MIDDDLDDPRARVTDPDTSHAAAEGAKAFSRGHAGLVRNVLGYAAGTPLSVEEVARRCTLKSAQITRAMSQLRKAGIVIDSGQRFLNDSGFHAAKWALARDQFSLVGE